MLIAALVIIWPLQAVAVSKSYDEHQVKAVFLYRLSLFISWPEEGFDRPDSAFSIGVLGEHPIRKHIARVVKNERVGDRPIIVKQYESLDDLLNNPCMMLFVGQSLRNQWPKLRQKIKSLAILTVSDMPNFSRNGGMITIRKAKNRIQIEINSDETRKAGFSVSSKLLKVARQVRCNYHEGDE